MNTPHMSEEELLDLLSFVTAYDGRTIGQADTATWWEAAKRARWTYAEAIEALHQHYAESTAWVMPGHVTERIRRKRSEPPRSATLPVATPRPAVDDHVRRVVEWLGEHLAADRDARVGGDRAALSVGCPRCGAEAHSSCVQTAGPGKRRAGHWPIEIPHLQRRQAYRRIEE